MSFWACTVTDCVNKSLFVNGDCRDCGARLCRDHAGKVAFHPCEGMDRETRSYTLRAQADKEMLETISSKLDIPTIIHQAETFRPGHTCHMRSSALEQGRLFCHGTNMNIPLIFEDGHKWMLRIRQPGRGRPPREAMRMTAMSEAATLRALQEGGAHVPHVWMPELAKEPDALIYYFVEYLDGKPYPPFLQTQYVVPTDHTVKAIYNVAKWFLTLERVSFDAVGSLHFDSDVPKKIVVGPVMDTVPQLGRTPFFRGPYKTAKERYVDFFDTALKQIIAGTRALAKHNVDDYLIAMEIRSLVSQCKELEDGPWYMKHGEDKGDHFMLREDGSVSGVIDWDWSYTSCKADAFIPPYSFNNGPYWDGSNVLCPYELALMDAYLQLGRPDMAEIVKNGKKFRRLNDFVFTDFPGFVQLDSLRRAFRGDPDANEGEVISEESVRATLLEKYKADEGLRFVVARHATERQED